MAVSKRLRYEILRRDNHQCQYCGAKAPDTVLRIDHVTPVALGGTDEPSNLCAACDDCNGGKSSASPDAALVAAVSSDALRWSAAMKQAAEQMRLHDNTAVYEAVVNAFSSFRRRQLPDDYRETIDQFLNSGLPADDIVQMAHVADAKPNIYNRWSYFCGCCWTRIRQLQELATEILAIGVDSVDFTSTMTITTCWTQQEIDDSIADAVNRLREHGREDITADDFHCEHGTECADVLCRLTFSWFLIGRLCVEEKVND